MINWFKQDTRISESQEKNPWLGLATYNTEDAEKFRGRDKAAQDLFSLIDNNLVVTLYGKSGIGKSSLINAGIIPMLNNVGYKVVHVNIREMKASCRDNASVYERTIANLKEQLHINLDIVDETSLWKILHDKECFEGISEFPIVIFDQFEEIFLDTRPNEADTFVKAVSKLTDTGFSIEDGGYIPNNRFRVLLSLREDDLFRLEDSIDRNSFSRMKANRYRLHSLNRSEAESIIAIGKENFDNYDSCKEKIIQMSSLPDGGIDAVTLSLLCYRLFEKTRYNVDNIIKEEFLSKENDPLFNQYMEEISSLSHKEQIFIENNLITSSGRRDLVDIEDFRNTIRNADKILENSESHFSLFRIIDHGRNVELIHDSLAKAIYKNKSIRDNMLERKWKWTKSFLISILCFCISIFPLLYAFNKYFYYSTVTTENKFFARCSWAWVILLVPILNCVLVTRERKIARIIPLVIICILMAINNGSIRTCIIDDISNLSRSFDFNLTVQILLFVVFCIYTFRLFNDKERITKFISILYLDLVTFLCLIPGFGHNVFKINNVIGYDSKISRPWSYVTYEKDNKYGYSDWNGNQVLPCVFDTIVVDSTLGNSLSKHVRFLRFENEGLRNYYVNKNNGFPCHYKDGILSFHILPMVENQIKKLSKETQENKLKASIIKQSRERVILSFANSQSLYDKELVKDINCLYKIQLNSTYHLLKSLNDSKSIITDESINNIRIALSRCICMLHMLETFGKQENILDDDIAHSILTLQFFTLFEVMDTNVKGYGATYNTNFNFNLISTDKTYSSHDYASFSLKGYLEKNKRDVYGAFNSLIFFDLAIHQTDLTEFLNNSAMNAKNIYNELLDVYDQTKKTSVEMEKMNALVLQNAISILLDNSSVSSKQKKISQLQEDVSNKYSQVLENTVKNTESLLNKPLYKHNSDVFNYRKVISPLIKCIAENDIPDQSTALTDIACRLMVMGMFRGLEMHDWIVELQNAYQRATDMTMKKTFETLLTIDSMEVEYRQTTNDFKRKLQDIKLQK